METVTITPNLKLSRLFHGISRLHGIAVDRPIIFTVIMVR